MREVREISIEQIHPNRHQPRLEFNEDALMELAQSIRENGLIQPITVREDEDGYEIIAGERRYKACILAGYSEVPCNVMSADEQKLAELALVENIQRENLTSIEEAKAYIQIMRSAGMTQEEADIGVAHYRDVYLNGGIYNNSTFPYIMELLQNLKEHGAKLCVATSKPEPMAKIVLDHLKVTPFLDYMAGADLDERHSNKTELIEKGLLHCNTKPSHAVMIGDTHFDAHGAKHANTNFIGVLYGYGTREEMERDCNRAIEQINKKMYASEYEDDYDENIKQKEINGHYYSLPAKRITSTILYNPQMFDDTGIPYPSDDWTYDEFIDTARKLTKGEGNDKVYGWFFPGYDAGQPALRMIESKLGLDWMYAPDGKSAAIDTEDVKDLTEKYLQRVEEGIEPSYVDVTTQKMEPANMLLTGKAAMVFGDWVVRNVKDTDNYPHDFKVGFARMPRLSADQENNYTTSYSDDLSINSKSQHPQEAMKFIKWYLEEGMDYVAPYARIPACKKYDADKVASLIFGEQSDLFDMESAKNIYLTPTDFYVRKNMPVATEINTILTEEFDKVFAGAQSVEETLQNAQKRADEKIAQEQECR